MTLKEKIKNGENIVGMHLNFSDPAVGKILGQMGYDFIWIDMEHSYLSFESLHAQILAIQGAGTPVIVRAPIDDLTYTKKIIEMGPDGIIFPMIHSAEDANRVLSYTLYPPYGVRGFGPMNAVGFGFKDIKEYVDTNHEDMCRFIQIEHVDAVKDLDNIMKNPFIDGYIVGANDLSGSINELMNVFGDNTTALIKETLEKLEKNGKYACISTGDGSEATIKHWHDMGFKMISAVADFDLLVLGAKKNLETLKKIHKGE